MGIFDFLAPQPSKGTFKQQQALTDQALAAAQANQTQMNKVRSEARGDVKTGIAKGSVPLTEATQVFDPLIGQKQGAYDLYQDTLGLNGAEGYGRAQTGFGNSLTGGDFALDFANNNYMRNAAAMGQLNSGGTAAGLYELGRGFQNQRVDNWMNRLQGEDPSNMYGNKATALSNLGNFYGQQYNNLANAGLQGGQLQSGAAGMTMGQFNNNAGLLGQQESMRLAAQQQGWANALGIGNMISGFMPGAKGVPT
jgi:hypothetical protein